MTSHRTSEPHIPTYREIMATAPSNQGAGMDIDAEGLSSSHNTAAGSLQATYRSTTSVTTSLASTFRSSHFFPSFPPPSCSNSFVSSSSGAPPTPKRSKISERPLDSVYQSVRHELQYSVPSDVANVILQYADRFAGTFATSSVDAPVVHAAIVPSDSPAEFSVLTASEQPNIKHRYCSNPFLPDLIPRRSPSLVRGLLVGTAPYNLSSLRLVCFIDRLGDSGRSLVAVATACGAILLYHVETAIREHAFNRATRPTVSLQASELQLNCLAKLDSASCASAGEDNIVKVWDLSTQRLTRTFLGHFCPIFSVCTVVGHPTLALSAGKDCTIKLWDTRSKQCAQTLNGHLEPVNVLTTITVTGEGDCSFVSASKDGHVKIWDPRTMKCLSTMLAHSGPARALTVGGMNRIISGGDDGVLKVWCGSSGECLQTLRAHAEPITSVHALPNGQLLSTAEDRTIKVWS